MLLPRENTEIDGGHKTVYQLVPWHALLAKSYAVNTTQSIGTFWRFGNLFTWSLYCP